MGHVVTTSPILIIPFLDSVDSLQPLTHKAQDRRRCAFRPGTLKNHWSAQTMFLRFAMLYGLNPDEATCDQLAAYTEWLLQGGLAVSTVRNHIAAVKALYSWMGNAQVIAILNSSVWSLTIRGLLNTVRPSYNTKATMTPEDLLALMEVSYHYDDLLPLTVALSFGFFGYLRLSNLVPQTTASFDKTRHTTVGDVFLRNHGLVVSLKWTKIRQANQAFPVPLPMLGSSTICPFRAWSFSTLPHMSWTSRLTPHCWSPPTNQRASPSPAPCYDLCFARPSVSLRSILWDTPPTASAEEGPRSVTMPVYPLIRSCGTECGNPALSINISKTNRPAWLPLCTTSRKPSWISTISYFWCSHHFILHYLWYYVFYCDEFRVLLSKHQVGLTHLF